MASAFTHAFVAIAAGTLYPVHGLPKKFWILCVACAILPDADAIMHAFRDVLGIPWGHPLGHRGITHTLLFALFVGMSVTTFAFREISRFSLSWWKTSGFFFIVTSSHGLLDALTSGGLGIPFFYPFDQTRYFFPWRPIPTSPIGIRSFFSERGLNVITTELTIIWLPVAVMTFLFLRLRRVLQAGKKYDPEAAK